MVRKLAGVSYPTARKTSRFRKSCSAIAKTVPEDRGQLEKFWMSVRDYAATGLISPFNRSPISASNTARS